MVPLYRDESLLAVAKPSGLAVHRGEARDPITAVDLARALAGGRVFPVHRLDRATSGVLLFALQPESARLLGAAFAEGRVHKRYLALVRGIPREPAGLIDHPIQRREDGPRVPARTAWRTLATVTAPGPYALVEARPETGRRHQVRRHLKHLGHPLIGDVRYGKGDHNRLFRQSYDLHRLALHAATLELRHPLTGAPVRVEAELPADFRAPLLRLGIPERAWRED
ncbi:MAG: pseudouridylate synthase [Deltaproteobacteria bacterium]|nr:pseudouridylate synthase [Deltaproteobacteria bacterium]MCB9788280.1 pseudouridylate synthase [Deltaproteobacteria bacterium]